MVDNYPAYVRGVELLRTQVDVPVAPMSRAEFAVAEVEATRFGSIREWDAYEQTMHAVDVLM